MQSIFPYLLPHPLHTQGKREGPPFFFKGICILSSLNIQVTHYIPDCYLTHSRNKKHRPIAPKCFGPCKQSYPQPLFLKGYSNYGNVLHHSGIEQTRLLFYGGFCRYSVAVIQVKVSVKPDLFGSKTQEWACRQLWEPAMYMYKTASRPA